MLGLLGRLSTFIFWVFSRDFLINFLLDYFAKKGEDQIQNSSSDYKMSLKMIYIYMTFSLQEYPDKISMAALSVDNLCYDIRVT